MRWMAEKLNTSAFFFLLCFCPTRFTTTLNSMKHKWKVRSYASAQVTLEVPRGLSWPSPASSCFCWFSCRWSIWPLGLELLGPHPVWSNATNFNHISISNHFQTTFLFVTCLWIWITVILLFIFAQKELKSRNEDLNRTKGRRLIYILFSKRSISVEDLPLSLWRNTLWWWH